MINTVWQGFPGFHVAFVIKRLLYIEFRVFRKKRKKGWRCRNDPDWLLPVFGFGLRQRFSLSQHGPLCRDMVLRPQGLQGSDRGFLGRDRVVSLLFFCHDRGPPCVATALYPLS